MLNYSFVEVSRDNLDQYPQVICFINAKHPLHHLKLDWLQTQFDKGLRIKLLFLEGEKKPVGFVEYTRGEECWRAVDAAGYIFIHCLWTNGKKLQHQGLGTALLNEVEHDAAGTSGVVLVTSDKGFMADRSLFLKNGYELVDSSGKEQLLVKRFSNSKAPRFFDWEIRLKEIQELTILYSRQCPWVARFIEEVQEVLNEYSLKPVIRELKTAQEAQSAPSVNTSFNLIYKGKLLADRYISVTRFRNIVKKEIL